MEKARPIVIHSAEGVPPPGPPTPGMDRRQLFDHGEHWIGWVQTEAGLAGGWHHHGDRDSYICLLRGNMAIEYGPAGRDRLEATAGDVVFNPARLVHREITGAEEPAELFVVRVGPGPLNVNVEGPDPE